MSILLAIIAINLFSISNTLKENGKLERDKQLCARQVAFVRSQAYEKEKKENEEMFLSRIRGWIGYTLKEMDLKITPENILWVTEYCEIIEEDF